MNENDEIAHPALGYIHRLDVCGVTAVAGVGSASIFRVKVVHPNYGDIMHLRNIVNASIPCKDPTADSTSKKTQ